MNLGKIVDMLEQLDPKEGWRHVEPIGDQPEVWYCVEDCDLRIEHHPEQDVVRDPFEEDWATRHPDKHAVSHSYHIWYGSTRIKDVVLVHVDGYRAVLPLPDGATKTIDSRSLDYKIAQIVDPFGGLAEYINRSGLTLK